MKAYHNSRELKFRDPFGAVQAGQKIVLKLDIWEGVPQSAVLRIWVDGSGELRIPMQISEREGGHAASAEYTPAEPGLHWYRFELDDGSGNTLYVGPAEGKKGGEGQTCQEEWNCRSWQITVTGAVRRVPDWYRKGLAYQIFPDRFAREQGVTESEIESRLTGHEKGPERKVVSWDSQPAYEKNEDGSIKAWDFYGGSLKGIEQKLPYLKSLGVSILYINPIFEAASSHRYDTGDYLHIDPVLGTEEDFARLCSEADKLGISVILDGVFNHAGCDSIYFNKYGNYPGKGAWEHEDSPYRDWFRFDPESEIGYKCWWGISDLPDFLEENEDLQEFIYRGKDSVVRKWMRLGAKGWRLDVADELPDSYIAGIKKAMLEENADDALLLGEVWEDASNKEAYSVRRKYFQGEELDCVMNYPFRDGVTRFLTGECSAEELCETLYSLLENYPKEAFYANLNLLGSHDRIRLFSLLGGAPEPDTLTDSERAAYRLKDDRKGIAKARLWLAALIQMTMPGVPCIYYGDEAGMEGYSDPYNRGPYPWGHEDKDCRTIFENAFGIRRSHEIFTDGDFVPFASGKDVIGFTRRLGDEAMTVLVNRSREEPHRVSIPVLGEYAYDVVSGRDYSSSEKEIEVSLYTLGSAVIYFSPKQRLGAELESGTGVLCHVTSLPNDGKPGTISECVYDFLDLLKKRKEKYWQILPLNPVDYTGSPYAGSSAFAGNPDLIPYSFETMKSWYDAYIRTGDDIMPADSIVIDDKAGRTAVSEMAAEVGKAVVKAGAGAAAGLGKAAARLGAGAAAAVRGKLEGGAAAAAETEKESAAADAGKETRKDGGKTGLFGKHKKDEAEAHTPAQEEKEVMTVVIDCPEAAADIYGYERFLADNASWIDGYAMYQAIRDRSGGKPWRKWDKEYGTYSDELWNDVELAAEADFYRYCQYIFEICWKNVRKRAKKLGIRIIGDIPIYVAADSAEAWQYPQYFTIRTDSDPEAEEFEAGVPPDSFAEEGQLWGNPLYRWDRLKEDGYQWWMQRFRRAFDLYDVVRLDHFRGFEAYWAVPRGQKALAGSWMQGPGRDLFKKAYEVFGPLPVIAEDLGFITPGVRALTATTGFPGMDVMQFWNGDPRYGYTPAEDRVAYTGTHDNETLFGWCMNRYGKPDDLPAGETQTASEEDVAAEAVSDPAAAELPASEVKRCRRISRELLRDFYKCGAFIRIVPLQDLLVLDNSARMNKPGTVGSNWCWQAEAPIRIPEMIED